MALGGMKLLQNVSLCAHHYLCEKTHDVLLDSRVMCTVCHYPSLDPWYCMPHVQVLCEKRV
jgi:hypothetical protein